MYLGLHVHVYDKLEPADKSTCAAIEAGFGEATVFLDGLITRGSSVIRETLTSIRVIVQFATYSLYAGEIITRICA